MGASVQVFSGLIRGGREHKKFGDPFEWAVSFQTAPTGYQHDEMGFSSK